MQGGETARRDDQRYLWVLTLGALGVVYGDIGTSPLYAMRECFSEHIGIPITHENVLGVLSLILWALIVIVSFKYVFIVLRADNRGEGGILALMALAIQAMGRDRKRRLMLEWIGLFGAALIYGDGVITPAISVLSAVEGLKVVTPMFEPYVVTLTVTILSGFFLIQRAGTGSVGRYFGPVILVWFVVLAILGLSSLISTGYVGEAFRAINPGYALRFLAENGWGSFRVLGSVFLVVTGAEALYADMGHFGRRPIRLGWTVIVFPALLLNYFGQGALLLSDPSTVDNPFYRLSPGWFQLPLVFLATFATIIASQAMLSGAFSITRQAVQLGYFPRLRALHTSEREIGQIYVPFVNFVVFLLTVTLVLAFRSSSNLAAAYGIAVSTTMVLTSTLTCCVARACWGWGNVRSAFVFGSLLFVDLMFFGANVIKIGQGGWIPVVMAITIFALMTTWRRGREILGAALQSLTPSFQQFLTDIKTDNSIRVPGTAIFMTRNIDRTPPALIHNVKHNKVVHKTVILLSVHTEEIPYVPDDRRLIMSDLGGGFYSMVMKFGFMENPDVPRVLEWAKKFIPDFTVSGATFFLGRETLLPTNRPGMALWREQLFAIMAQNAQRATHFYQIPPEQVIEIGFQVPI